jgi:cell division protein FtsL
MVKKTYVEPVQGMQVPQVTSVPTSVRNRLSDVENLTKTVLFVVAISLVGVLIALYALISDNMHYNNETYKEQSGSFQTQLNTLQSEVNTLKSSK